MLQLMLVAGMKCSELLGSSSSLCHISMMRTRLRYSSELTYGNNYQISRQDAVSPERKQHYKTDSMLSHISWSSRLYMNLVLLAGFCVISLPRLSRVTLEEKSSVGVR